jgi:hypothetical protein
MKIIINDSEQFGRLLKDLADEMVTACIHFKLYSDLNAAVNSYVTELNQSPAFWSYTFRAHLDTVLSRLCRIYDQHKKSLNLKNLLDTIKTYINIFDVKNFRERLKDNPFVDSLASWLTKPNIEQLEKDIHFVSKANPSVKRLLFWRNNTIVHKNAEHVINNFDISDKYPLSFDEIKQLLKEGTTIINRYSNLFHATTYSTQIVGHDDYQNVLKAVRAVIKQHEKKIARAWEVARAMEASREKDS